MLDIFLLYSKGIEIYLELVKTNPNVDISIPSLLSGLPEFKVEILKSENNFFFEKYTDFSPPNFCCKFSEIENRLLQYIDCLQGNELTLDKEFGQALQKLLYSNGVFLGQIMLEILQKKCSIRVYNDFFVTFKLKYPAKFVISYKNLYSVIYDFSTKKLIFSGIENVDKSISFPLEVIDIQSSSEFILENNYCGDIFISCNSVNKNVIINEDIDKETSNDILDKIIQSMILIDMMDALQDVYIDDENSGLILCFDPVLDNEEINLVLATIKQKYAGAKLTSSPREDDSSWWIIEIYKSKSIQTQIEQSYTLDFPRDTGNSAGSLENKGTISIEDLSKEINANSLINSIDKG